PLFQEMRSLRAMLRPVWFQRRRWLSTSSSPSDDIEVKSFLPSEAFVKQFVKRPSHREKLTSLISELQIFLEMFGKDSLPQFTDSIWFTYFNTWLAEERCEFLNHLRLERKNRQLTDGGAEKEQISVINQRKYDNGEMVYAPGFNTLVELRGQDFRGVIDRMYGSRLLSLQRCEEELPKLIVDCRFLTEFSIAVQSTFVKQIQALHDSNWNSRLPFNITVANFRPDNQLAEIIKRHLLFHFGPPSSSDSFSRHPFAPTLTTKGIEYASGSPRSDIMYISWRATQFLPDEPPPNVRAVVLCASKDHQPWSSSVSAAVKDGIEAYRLPLERYVRFEKTTKHLPLSAVSSILRSYFRKDDIGESIRLAVELRNKNARPTDKTEQELFERYKAVVRDAVAKAKEEKPPIPRIKPEQKKPKKHRYTREERRKMREEQAMLSSQSS
uniref:Protein C56G2.3 n=2 Tax=Haemonchus contortus TaxID=6289 RepID=A0A7I4XYL9_HAECO